MRSAKEDEPCTKKRIPDLVSAVKELHALSSQDLSKRIRDAENGTIHWTKGNGSSIEINVENLARYLPLHLLTKLLSSPRNEELFRHLLSGFRLLHTLCDLAPRHSKLEQVLLDDVKVSEQMLDLTFRMTIVLQGFRQKVHASSHLVILHSALLASSFYLLTACISSQWHELTQVLLAHPKVDIFMRVAFPAVRGVIYFLQVKLSTQHTVIGMRSNLDEVNRHCQHCEASLQFLQSLCQQKLFRERLVKNKELCEDGGVLLLVQDIMKLPSCEDSQLMAVVSRLKSKVLSILLHLCEVESVSFLDLAASTSGGLDLAKSTVSEVLELLKIMFCGDLNGLTVCSVKDYPRGILQLNAMRLTEILSDDSNFRSYIVLNLTEVLTTIFSLPHGEFLSSWCSSELEPSEYDVTLDYDSLAASGCVLGVISPSHVSESTFSTCRAPQTSYAHQRTSLLVKIIANLTCFVPDLCKEEKDLFINKFLQCLQKELSKLPDGVAHSGGAERAAAVSRNLRSLLVHAESLIPGFLNEDDVQLLRLFIRQLEALITPQESNIHRVKEVHSKGQCSSPAPQRSSPDGSGNQNEGMSRNSALDQPRNLNFMGNGEDQSNGVQEREKNAQNNLEFSEHVKEGAVGRVAEEEMVRSVQSEEKQQLKRRKRNIMNEMQVAVIENALRDEPDMQRKAASIQFWADKLCLHGSEVTPSQLKNWLNNRKAKLARAAAKDVRVASGVDDKQGGGSGADPSSESPESPPDEFFDPSPSAPQASQQKAVLRICGNEGSETVPTTSFKRERGQYVVLMNEKGEEIGRGYIHLTNAIWFGRNLEENGLCVVDVTYLKVDKSSSLPQPCDATGTTFEQAEQILGRKRLLWDSTKLLLAPPPQQQQQQSR